MDHHPITAGDMQAALLTLRKRTGDNTLSHSVKAGRFQLNRVVYGPRGRSNVTPLSQWQEPAAHLETLNTYAPTHTIAMSDFFALPEVIAAQNVQKRNPYGSDAHRKAHDSIVEIATRYGAQDFIGEY